MAKDINRCPKCGSYSIFTVGEKTGGFSVGKAALGGILLGPIGIAGGLLGKKKTTYCCSKCGYTIEV